MVLPVNDALWKGIYNVKWPVTPLIALCASVAILAGCGGTVAGTAAPAPPENIGEQLPHSGAPKIENPVDELATINLFAKPCRVIPKSQLAKINVKVRELEPLPEERFGPVCDVRLSKSSDYVFDAGNFYIKLWTDISGLSNTYERRGDPYSFFEETTVGGRPAVRFGLSDNTVDGFCQMTVGLSDKLVLDISTHLDTEHKLRSKPCTLAKDVLEIALRNTLKAVE